MQEGGQVFTEGLIAQPATNPKPNGDHHLENERPTGFTD